MLRDIIRPLTTLKEPKPETQRSSGSSPATPAGCAAKITVLLADDHNIVREGLRLLIESAADMQVVAEAENGRQALQKVIELRPDVAVLDLAMPILNGLEATKQILKAAPETKILILSSYTDEERVRQLVHEGALGYLIKQSAATDLLKAIRETRKGNAFFSPCISRKMLEQMRENFVNGGSVQRKSNTLTTRETEVLQLIAEGYANKQMAAELCISIKTVEKHRQAVMNKLNIHDVAGLTRHAIAKGFTMPVFDPAQAPALRAEDPLVFEASQARP
ncbi:MAG: LuxR family transcriptional regulator [Verrucomicrobiales bacterium]|nr:LuxR family transcriptional regulator [Verrucomicrobiales bacterium]